MAEDFNAGGTLGVMLQLGGEDGFQFSVDTAAYKTLQRRSQYNWPAQERIGSSPALQSTGPGKDEIDLNGVIYPHYKGGLRQMPRLRNMAGEGKPYLLQDAKGVSWGKWCIVSIRDTQSAHLPGGDPRKIEFGIKLEKYGTTI